MKIKPRKKCVKGMTLIEVIIAIFVLGIMGTIMARIATTSCTLMKSANHMNNKTALEAPAAAAQVKDDTLKEVEDVDIKITGGISGKTMDEVSMKGTKYSSQKKAEANEKAKTDDVNADLVYYTIN